MTLRTVLVLLLGSALACAATSQRGNVIRARGQLVKGDYQDALSIAEFAISQGDAAPAAKLHAYYLKAQSLEGLKRTNEAIGVYQFLVEQFPDDAIAFQARGRLADLGELCESD